MRSRAALAITTSIMPLINTVEMNNMIAKLAFFAMFSIMVVPADAEVRTVMPTHSFQSPFAVYAGDAPWDEEVVFLYQLSSYLQKYPDAIGQIVYYSDGKISRKRLKRRLARSVRYLTTTGSVNRKRLKVYYGGRQKRAKVVLQPCDEATNCRNLRNKDR